MSPERLFRSGGPFFLIAGPCVLEEDRVNVGIGEALARLSEELDLPIIFKASFDKANRSSAGSKRGPGIEEGLRRLARVRGATGLPVLTDVHQPEQC
ncbi:MAG: 3-deoxy-8-phosphooctulonate synthase, partial [Gemmatimonadota bacterium]|nr:3-deoxy-8-phosphooctulonate synthase [Gemmatimonadota bacterium]